MTGVVVDACPICGNEECEHSDEARELFTARREAGAAEPYLAGDPGQVAKASKRVKRGETQDVSDLRWLMRHESGRRFMWALLGRCGVGRTSVMNRVEPNGLAIAFAEGERNIGLDLQNRLMTHCVAEYAAMLKENGGINVS